DLSVSSKPGMNFLLGLPEGTPPVLDFEGGALTAIFDDSQEDFDLALNFQLPSFEGVLENETAVTLSDLDRNVKIDTRQGLDKVPLTATLTASSLANNDEGIALADINADLLGSLVDGARLVVENARVKTGESEHESRVSGTIDLDIDNPRIDLNGNIQQ